MVVPAQYMRATLREIGPDKLTGKTLILCAKGIEIDTGELLSTVVRKTAPGAHVAILTGPTFAHEIANGLPAAVTLAASDLIRARDLAGMLGSKTFRPYASDDITGAEVGGAVKNVLAIACGIVSGRKYGDSARAALLTRGMNEMMRLALALGGRRETLMGMCGLGDLVLTANSMQSRNFSLGFALGEGKTLPEIMGGRTAVTEGVHTSRAVMNLIRKLNVDLPVMTAVHGLLHEGKTLEAVIEDLLSRPFGDE
jgi:glycerol-3-phosphate dehydrogenase (NAD(P)+)